MVKDIENDFEITISLPLEDADNKASIERQIQKTSTLSDEEISSLEIKRRSIDARRGKISFVYTLGQRDTAREARLDKKLSRKLTGVPVIVIGSGPAGLFCAYELARSGKNVIICDRGKRVQARRKDLKLLNQQGDVDENSNYCFGEGGAGTYSDGKLYTRSHKRGNVREVLEILVGHGANANILTDARPHIGSNKLPKIINAFSENLLQAGVEINFGARVIDLIVDKSRVRGVVLEDGREILGESVVVASGHSAADIYEILHRHGVKLEVKPFAMGVRIEHPQALINAIQYGRFAGHKSLPSAYYRLAYTPRDGRGAFSFCMCPGGWIVPASTESAHLVVNGMSLSKRNSAFANSGLVVAVSVDDVLRHDSSTVLAGIELQRQLEAKAYTAGGGKLCAPAARVTDFLKGRISKDLPSTSYIPGLNAADLYDVLDIGVPLAARLKEAIHHFERIMPGYITDEAVLVGVESRTSSPVRMWRDPDKLSASLDGLYPCGEGSGYAGGIVSAAMDGIKIARKLLT